MHITESAQLSFIDERLVGTDGTGEWKNRRQRRRPIAYISVICIHMSAAREREKGDFEYMALVNNVEAADVDVCTRARTYICIYTLARERTMIVNLFIGPDVYVYIRCVAAIRDKLPFSLSALARAHLSALSCMSGISYTREIDHKNGLILPLQ